MTCTRKAIRFMSPSFDSVHRRVGGASASLTGLWKTVSSRGCFHQSDPTGADSSLPPGLRMST
jgi:hypothetical protein